MFLAKIVGNVWATQKAEGLVGKKMMLVAKLNGNPPSSSKDHLMAICDKIDAGIGDTVLVMDEGGSARDILEDKTAPIRTIIVGVVDTIQLGSDIYNK